MNKKSQSELNVVLVVLFIIFLFCVSFFVFAFDTGVMSGTMIGYDSTLFGNKKVYVLEQKTVYTTQISQSEIVLCSDSDDVEIHKLIENNLNKKVIIEYKEKRIGFYFWNKCRDTPITGIKIIE